MSIEADMARLEERLSHVIVCLNTLNTQVDTLMTAYQVQTGKSLVIKTLAGTALAGMGAGALKVIEWLTHNPPQPPYHP